MVPIKYDPDPEPSKKSGPFLDPYIFGTEDPEPNHFAITCPAHSNQSSYSSCTFSLILEIQSNSFKICHQTAYIQSFFIPPVLLPTEPCRNWSAAP